jgi:hypothetical protein
MMEKLLMDCACAGSWGDWMAEAEAMPEDLEVRSQVVTCNNAQVISKTYDLADTLPSYTGQLPNVWPSSTGSRKRSDVDEDEYAGEEESDEAEDASEMDSDEFDTLVDEDEFGLDKDIDDSAKSKHETFYGYDEDEDIGEDL